MVGLLNEYYIENTKLIEKIVQINALLDILLHLLI